MLLDGGEELNAPNLINATGSWAPELTTDVPVKKRKGHLVITDRYPGFVRHQLVELGYLKSAHSDFVEFCRVQRAAAANGTNSHRLFTAIWR